jgi:hypothetical protein
MAAASESESTAAKLAKAQSFAEDLCQETSQHAKHVLMLTEGLYTFTLRVMSVDYASVATKIKSEIKLSFTTRKFNVRR